MGHAYFCWRTLILQKFGPAYFDSEHGAQATWVMISMFSKKQRRKKQ